MMSENIETLFTKGTLRCIMNNGIIQNPVLQILGFHKLSIPGRIDRFILNVSDSSNFCQYVIVATQLNYLISSKLTKYSIVQLKNYEVDFVSDPVTENKKKVIVILDLDVLALGDEVGIQVGEPTEVYVHDLLVAGCASFMSSQTFEVHETLKGLTTRSFMNNAS